MVGPKMCHFQVIEVVLASTFIPIFSGWVPPRYRGTRVMGRFRDRKRRQQLMHRTNTPFEGEHINVFADYGNPTCLWVLYYNS